VGSSLPRISPQAFRQRLVAAAGWAERPGADRLHVHYEELRKWNPRVALVGPAAAEDIVERHYAESLAALPRLPTAARILDLGSGAGFPGLILAAALPDAEVTLVEARERKWAFLMAAAQRCELSVRCLNARVALPLPEAFPQQVEAITVRALRLPEDLLSRLARHLAPAGRLLIWTGTPPSVPAQFVPEAAVPLGHGRRIEVYRLAGAGAGRP
jgi:16S rRNA (guanine527-N7)-methyltransferase